MINSFHKILFPYKGINKIYKALLHINTTVARSQGQMDRAVYLKRNSPIQLEMLWIRMFSYEEKYCG